jgi:hypothetical protein
LLVAEIRLGTLPDEPAPTIASVLVNDKTVDEPLVLVAFTNASELMAALQSGELDAALLEQPMEPLAGVSQITELYPSVLAADPDIFFIFGGLLAPDALQRLGDYRLWSLGDTDKLMHGSVAESLMLRYPNLRPFVLPAEIYPTLGREAASTDSKRPAGRLLSGRN